VKSVIQGMLIHSISIYSWPKQLLKEMETWIRNFIWSGDIAKRKLVTVSWSNACKPILEGGLGIRSLCTLNDSANLKLYWEFFNSSEDWARLLRSKVLRGMRVISDHIFSSLWSSFKSEVGTIQANSSWIIGLGENINFWLDNWCGDSIANHLNFPQHLQSNLTAMVSDFIDNFQWRFPRGFSLIFPSITQPVSQVSLLVEDWQDKLAWKHNNTGELSFKDSFLFKYGVGQNVHWAKYVWSPDIPPSKSFFVRRMLHNRAPTDENLMLRGSSLPSMCSSCNSQAESSPHLFFDCPFAIQLWNWLASILNFAIPFTSWSDILQILDRIWSLQCKVVIQSCLINLIYIIWFNRNQARFQDKKMHWKSVINVIIANVALSGNKTNKATVGDMLEFTILKACKVMVNPPRAPTIKEVLWSPPINTWIKVNTDGASTKNPVKASAGEFLETLREFALVVSLSFLVMLMLFMLN